MSDVTQGIAFGISSLTGGTVQVTAGSDVETWAFDTEINAASATLVDVRDNLLAWLNSGSRAWSGSYTFTASIVSRSLRGPGLGLEIVASGSVTFTFNATARDVLNIGGALAVTGATFTSNGAAPGTLYAPIVLFRWLALPPGDGTISGDGSWRNAQPSHAKKIPAVAGIVNELEAAKLSDLIPSVYSPRTAHIYQPAQSVWRFCMVGDLRLTRSGATFYDLTVEAASA